MTDDHGTILRLVPPPPTTPPQEAIDMMRDMLARIESGDVVAVAIAAASGGNEFHTCWYGWSGRLVAPTQLLAARLMTDLRGQ